MTGVALGLDRKELVLNLKILSRDPLYVVGAITSLTFVLTALVVSVFGTGFLPYDPDKINLSVTFLPPSSAHLFGTDNLGRDILSRVIAAAPVDAEIGFVIVGASSLLGIALGSVSGYFGGRVDEVMMRVTDLFLAFPSLVLAVAIAVALGPGINHVIEATFVAWWPIYARLARAGALSLKESQFVNAAKVAGASPFSIIRRHILPNNVSPIVVYATLDIGNAILYASVLSYLGLGAQPPQSEWGSMVYQGQNWLGSAWWVSIIPGVTIFIVALGFNLLGDALRDTLDPRYRR